MQTFIRTNYRIRVPQVRCLDADGNMLGVITTDQARQLARERGLDLVEVSPKADPPVCRIMDFGKFRYEEQRKERMARKKQHSLALKEMKFFPNIEDHDYNTKLNHIKDFLAKGHKVKLAIFFRGRENAHRDLGFKLAERLMKDCSGTGAVDMAPRMIGRSILAVLSPSTLKGIRKPPVVTAGPAPVRPAQPTPASGSPAVGAPGLTTPVPARPSPPVPASGSPSTGTPVSSPPPGRP